MLRVIRISMLMGLLLTGLAAQTPTGTLQGTVSDQTGASVPGASVLIKNTETNVAASLKTDSGGRFIKPMLPPGTYRVEVTSTGFQPMHQDGIKLDVGQNRSVDFKLNLGSEKTEITVVAEAVALDVNTSALGAVVDNKKVQDLPLNGRNPFSLAALSPGVSTVGNASTPHLGGSRNAVNEQQIDGVSNIVPQNNVGNNNTVYTPIVDSVQEFSVQINALSAEYGRFGGGVINIVTKSGTNTLHGSGFEFTRNAVLNANDFFANRAGRKKPDMRKNQFGGTLGGPVYIPGAYDGRNKSFFFFGIEANRDSNLATATNTVPLLPFREGDFSAFPAVIYDPLTATEQPDGTLVRSPFAGNQVPSARFSAAGAKVMSYYPEPNAGAAGALYNNLFTVGTTNARGKHWDAKIDHNFSERRRMFLRLSHSTTESEALSDYGNAASQGWGGPYHGGAWSASLDHLFSISATLLLDLRYGIGRSTAYASSYSAGFDLTSLGFPQSLAAVAAQNLVEFPRFDMSNASGLGPNGWNNWTENPLSHDATASLTKITRRHTIKMGGEVRKMFLNFMQFGHPSGQYSFDTGWTQKTVRQYDGSGSSYAALLLGVPSSGSMTHDPSAADSSTYMALYVQDDWKVSPTFTLNLGLRWDVDLPRTERYNRLSVWNPSVASPLAGLVPADACLNCGKLMGAMQFTGTDGAPYGRHQGPTQWKDFAPRIGFAWNVTPSTVIRSGFGLAYAPSALQAAGTSGSPGIQGFASATSMLTSNDGQRSVYAYLDNPFPAGFNLPLGAASGPGTDIGGGIWDAFFSSYRNPYSIQWNYNVQRRLPGGMTFEAGYLGNRGLFLIDGDPGLVYDQVHPSYLALKNKLYEYVPNPFYGLITTPGSALSQPTIQYSQLLRPYPQYTYVLSTRKPTANSIYHGVTMRLDKRFSNGLTFLVSYTGGKTMDNSAAAVTFLGPVSSTRADAYNGRLEWSISPQDVSQNLVTSFVYDLPFGRGKRFLTSGSKVTNLLVAGWQTNGILMFATGTPAIIAGASVNTTSAIFTSTQRPNNNGRSAKLSNPTITKWFDTSVFSNPAPFTFGNLSRTLPDVRNPGVCNTDLSLFKNNYFGPEDRYNLQFRVEAFNALNHAQFGRPDSSITSGTFGRISSLAHTPREVQLAVKFLF